MTKKVFTFAAVAFGAMLGLVHCSGEAAEQTALSQVKQGRPTPTPEPKPQPTPEPKPPAPGPTNTGDPPPPHP
jgi:hypothetical protein